MGRINFNTIQPAQPKQQGYQWKSNAPQFVKTGTAAMDNLFNSGESLVKDAWGKLLYWDNRPSQAIETTIGKFLGDHNTENLHPMDVLTGKQQTNYSGQDLMKTAMNKVFGETPQTWKYKVPEFVGGLAIDIATDPFMYFGLGEANKFNSVLKNGKRLGSLSDEGIKAIQESLKEKDLIKIAPEVIEAEKLKIADRFMNGEKKLIDTGGVKFRFPFFGKKEATIVSQDSINKFGNKIADTKMYNFLSESKPIQYAKNFFHEIFNPAYVGGNIQKEVPKDFFDAYHNFLNANSQIKKSSVDKAIKFLGKDLTPEEATQFFDLANTGKRGGNESQKVLDLYNKYLNEWRPQNTARAKNLGLKNELDNYIRNYYPELANWKEKYATVGRPIKEFKPGSFKQRLTDEEWYRGFLKSQGTDSKEIDRLVKNAMDEKKLPHIATDLKKSYGLSTDPHLALAQEEAELSLKENTHNFITDTINKYGKKINQEDVINYKKQGYGIFYPSSPLRFYPSEKGVGVAKANAYAFENPAISNFLNKFSTDVGQNAIVRRMEKLSNKMVNIYFVHPQSVLYHAMHNVAYNTWLSGGIDAFDNITRGIDDVIKENETYQRALKAGALRPQYEKGTVKELVDRELNRTSQKKKDIANLFNPLNEKHLMNRVFYGSDESLRMNLFRNALQRGSSDKEAADFVNHFAGNYKDLSNIEKESFRLLYPYYSWFKTNVKANFGAWATHPERQLISNKVWNSLNEALTGRPMWQNAPGATWKIATGRKDNKGKEIYVNPSVSGTIVPQIVENPFTSTAARMTSGPIPNLLSLMFTDKTTFENITRQTPIQAMPGAPAGEKIKRIAEMFLPYEMQKGAQKPNADVVEILTGWDKAHPLWENLMQTIGGFSFSTPQTAGQQKAREAKQQMQYRKSYFRQLIRAR